MHARVAMALGRRANWRARLAVVTLALLVLVSQPMVSASAHGRRTAPTSRSLKSSPPPPSQPTTSSALPSPIVATWVRLDPVAASEEDGLPLGRCDHTFELLTGHSQRPNTAVPFPNAQEPTLDSWADKVWMFSGHQDSESTQFSDSWLLDLSQSPPVWSKVNYSNISCPVTARWSAPVAFVPNGVVPSDVGLTAVLFSGIGSSSLDQDYRNDVVSFNFATSTWRQLSQVNARDEGMPFPRGYTEWFSLPQGYGSDSLSSTTDSGAFFLMGGLGASNGIVGSTSDRDWADQWTFNLTALSWERIGEFECVKATMLCQDSQPLSSFLANLSTLASPTSSPVDVTQSVRPAEIFSEVQRIVDGWAQLNLTATSLVNNPNVCRNSCIEFVAIEPEGSESTIFTPLGIEGTRGVIVDGLLYEFGGYECTSGGVQTLGGDACWLGSMFVMDLTTMYWTEIKPPSESSPFFPYWPSRRGYNTLVAHQEKKLIIVQGGAYQDISGVFYFYSDQYIFDIATLQFVPFTVGGESPAMAWSAGAVIRGDDIYMHGGCQGSKAFDQLFVLRLGLAVVAGNCFASGAGLHNATAGELATFTIQTREFRLVTYGTHNKTRRVWGSNMTFGTGLDINVQLVSTAGDDITLTQASVQEIGGGEYQVSYMAHFGVSFKIYVYMADTEIPGSPFSMNLAPNSVVCPARSTLAGLGISMAAKGQHAEALIQVEDQFGNSFQDTSVWLPVADPNGLRFTGTNNESLLFTATIGPDATQLTCSGSSVITNNYNGTLTLRYSVPYHYEVYLLSVALNNQSLSGSPFTVVALNPIAIPTGVTIAFTVLVAVNVAICLIASALVHLNRNEAVIRGSSPNFLQLLILGSILSSLSVIFLLQYEHDFGCQAFYSFLSIGLVVSMSALLAKSHRVERIFNAKQLKAPANNSDSRLLVPTVAVILAMVLLNVLWITINPLRSLARPSSVAHVSSVLTFQVCTGENGTAWLITLLVFGGVLLLYGMYLAVRTGHVPEQFNESRLLAACLYHLFFVIAVIVPLLFFIGNSSEFLTGRVVIQSLTVLWCSLFNILALVGSKFIVLLSSKLTEQDDSNFLTAGAPMPHEDALAAARAIDSGLRSVGVKKLSSSHHSQLPPVGQMRRNTLGDAACFVDPALPALSSLDLTRVTRPMRPLMPMAVLVSAVPGPPQHRSGIPLYPKRSPMSPRTGPPISSARARLSPPGLYSERASYSQTPSPTHSSEQLLHTEPRASTSTHVQLMLMGDSPLPTDTEISHDHSYLSASPSASPSTTPLDPASPSTLPAIATEIAPPIDSPDAFAHTVKVHMPRRDQ